ncbi:baseplate J/gp47 family protein [Pelagicoccus sp. SDUM812005]|uniref:baseplate J/gp47 family protein n=1 Tax=Pelagicoccus sp. SDUM812005 TaxID=3041257 RepID=UPI00281083EC|nr:baseplate J/gp47 family protein [Pelagicoccus sp. SDUM812005]MDQ8180558.1 baseplate J/gp47 family protein [Pelagicoccus sp. SDUM812005]
MSSLDSQTVSASPGTSQSERAIPALDPSTAPLDGRSDAQLAAFAQAFASQLAFWTSDKTFAPNVDWAQFLPDLSPENLPDAQRRAAREPQVALFLAFLQLYRHARGELNGLTARHLDFQYRQVLRLQAKPAQADHAHLVLQPKKNASSIVVPAGAAFSAKPDLRYTADIDSVIQPVSLNALRILASDPQQALPSHAAIANSLDGLGESLPEESPSWHPFGYQRDLPPARHGFAISSPMLVLQEGTRDIFITLDIHFSNTPPSESETKSLFEDHASATLSGEEDWIAANSIELDSYQLSGDTLTLTLQVSLAADADPIVPFDSSVLEGAFDTVAPVMKVSIDATAPASTSLAFSDSEVRGLKLKTVVSGMRDLTLENDHGRLDPSKPFLPFGPTPKPASSFYIATEEARHKPVTDATLTITWKDAPESLSTHYAAYLSGNSKIVSDNSHFTAKLQILRDGVFKNLSDANEKLFDESDASKTVTLSSDDDQLQAAVIGFKSFTNRFSRSIRRSRIQLPYRNLSVAKPLSPVRLAPAVAFRAQLKLPKFKTVRALRPNTRNGFLRLRLNQSFLHDRYANLLASALIFNANESNTALHRPLPNPPYTPEISEFSLGYTAETDTVDPRPSDSATYESSEIRLYHISAFGQKEVHGHLAPTSELSLLPNRDFQGQLIVGIDGLEAKQNINLLVQVEDGSANPDASRASIQWSALASNQWIPIDKDDILFDSTNGFQSSGIVQLLVPPEANTQNTWLEPGTLWLKAEVAENRDGVCRLRDVQLNAIPVTLAQPETASHLSESLPAASIDSHLTPLRGLKEVQQPFDSFGGAAPESDSSFRRRTSERLRHRARAVTAWDFERLVLEAFPKIYRAQCLPHTNASLERQAGAVTLVALPDTRGMDAAASLQPKVDAATLAEINDYLATLSSPFATARAVNPSYEPIALRFKVAFHKKYPFPTYKRLLNEALVSHLAPWSTSADTIPDFQGSIYRSALIAFIDDLEYVDYVTELQLSHAALNPNNAKTNQAVTASKPGALLTSVANHDIEDAKA